MSNDEQIEKTLSMFQATNLILASQYRNISFTKYSELIAYMLLAEKTSNTITWKCQNETSGDKTIA